MDTGRGIVLSATGCAQGENFKGCSWVWVYGKRGSANRHEKGVYRV